MKKGIIVLLIAVLVAGFAFADGKAGDAKFTGSATLSYDYDLSLNDTGFNNASEMTYSFTFEFNTAKGESKGEGKVYGEIAATADVKLVADKLHGTNNLTPKATLKISKANIVAGDITIDILGPKGLYSFAELYANSKYDDGKINPEVPFADIFAISGLGLGDHGFRVLYKDYEASFAFWRFGDNTIRMGNVPETLLYAGAKAPVKINDDMTVTAGANFFIDKADDDDNALIVTGGGFKFAYAPKDETNKLGASLAADLLLVKYETLGLDIMPIDISAQVKYDFIKFDAYFFSLDKFDKDLFELFAAKVSADYKVNDQISVGGYAELIWIELLNDGSKPDFRFGAEATYTAEKFTASAGVDAYLVYDAGEEKYKLAETEYLDGKKHEGLGIWADVSSDAVIDNATVGLKWEGADLSKKGADDKLIDLGTISAYVTIAF